MSDLIIKILEDINNHVLVYIFLAVAVIYGLLLGYGVIGLTLLSFAIGILVGQHTPRNDNKKPQPKIENKLGDQLRKNLQAGLARKYPERFGDPNAAKPQK